MFEKAKLHKSFLRDYRQFVREENYTENINMKWHLFSKSSC